MPTSADLAFTSDLPAAATASVLGTLLIVGTPTDAAAPTVPVVERLPGLEKAIYGGVAAYGLLGANPTLSDRDTITYNNGFRFYYQGFLLRDVTLDRLALDVATAGGTGLVTRIAIWRADVNWQPTALIADLGSVATDTTGIKTATISQVVTAGRVLVSWRSSGGTTGLQLTAVHSFPIGCPAIISPTTLGGTPYLTYVTDAGTGAYSATPLAWDSVAVSSGGTEAPVFFRQA